MEQQLLQILNIIQPLGYPAALIVFILYGLPKIIELLDKKIVKNNLLPQAEETLLEIKENHLHEIKECIEKLGAKLDTMNSTLGRMENNLNENGRDTAYIKARITNGK